VGILRYVPPPVTTVSHIINSSSASPSPLRPSILRPCELVFSCWQPSATTYTALQPRLYTFRHLPGPFLCFISLHSSRIYASDTPSTIEHACGAMLAAVCTRSLLADVRRCVDSTSFPWLFRTTRFIGPRNLVDTDYSTLRTSLTHFTR